MGTTHPPTHPPTHTHTHTHTHGRVCSPSCGFLFLFPLLPSSPSSSPSPPGGQRRGRRGPAAQASAGTWQQPPARTGAGRGGVLVRLRPCCVVGRLWVFTCASSTVSAAPCAPPSPSSAPLRGYSAVSRRCFFVYCDLPPPARRCPWPPHRVIVQCFARVQRPPAHPPAVPGCLRALLAPWRCRVSTPLRRAECSGCFVRWPAPLPSAII